MIKPKPGIIGVFLLTFLITQVISIIVSSKIIATILNALLIAIGLVLILLILNKNELLIKSIIEKFSPDKFNEDINEDVSEDLKLAAKERFHNLRQTFKKQVLITTGVSGIGMELNNIADASVETMDFINDFTEEICSSGEKQSSMVEDIKVRVEEITQRLKEVSKDMQDASNFTKESIDSANKGIGAVSNIQEKIELTKEVISDISVQIQSVNESSEKVVDMTNLISSIASQTNMLALNASIEAARAGEAGRGFTVVADEVGKLSLQTSNASSQIEEIVRKLNDDLILIQEIVKEKIVVLEEGYSEISETIKELTGIDKSLNTSVSKVEGVNIALENIEEHSENVASEVEEISEFTNSLSHGMKENYNEILNRNEKISNLKNISNNLYEKAIAMQQSIIGEIMEEKMLKAVNLIKDKIGTNKISQNEAEKLVKELNIDCLHVTDETGLVIICNERFEPFNLYDADPSFKELKSGNKKYTATPIKARLEDGKPFKFLAILDRGRIYQVGLSIDSLIKY